jgi:hypothetical protein
MRYGLNRSDFDFQPATYVTFGRGAHAQMQIFFAPLETAARNVPGTQIRVLCHYLIDQLPDEAYAPLVDHLRGLVDYYSMPISVTPSTTVRQRKLAKGPKREQGPLDLEYAPGA